MPQPIWARGSNTTEISRILVHDVTGAYVVELYKVHVTEAPYTVSTMEVYSSRLLQIRVCPMVLPREGLSATRDIVTRGTAVQGARADHTEPIERRHTRTARGPVRIPLNFIDDTTIMPDLKHWQQGTTVCDARSRGQRRPPISRSVRARRKNKDASAGNRTTLTYERACTPRARAALPLAGYCGHLMRLSRTHGAIPCLDGHGRYWSSTSVHDRSAYLAHHVLMQQHVTCRPSGGAEAATHHAGRQTASHRSLNDA